jgi:transposase-like protein
MIIQVLHCPYCQGIDIVKHGLSPEGKQRYRCRTCLEGRGRTFLLDSLENLPYAATGRGSTWTAYPHCSRRRVRGSTL